MKTLLLIFFSLFSLPMLAQEVSNVQVRQENDELIVTFDISGSLQQYVAEIELAEDGKHYQPFGELIGRNGRNEYKIILNGPVYTSFGIFRIKAQKFIGIIDMEGNIYQTVTIGRQVWMKENLKVSKYRNGDVIPTGLSDAAWQKTTIGAYAIFNNDAANNITYGKLYNGYAVADPRGLCPAGWHVPSDGEWTELEEYLGGTSEAGGKMKATTLWHSPNNYATNSSGLTCLPGGFRGYDGSFAINGYYGFWWCSTLYSSSTESLNHCSLGYYNGFSERKTVHKAHGFSVRCLRD